MGKKLAIKGNPTRGKEVIELLEMMGGKNKDDMFCSKFIFHPPSKGNIPFLESKINNF